MRTITTFLGTLVLFGCVHVSPERDVGAFFKQFRDDPRARCETRKDVRLCRVHSASEFAQLRLDARDATASRVLDALTREVAKGEHRYNHWLSFVAPDAGPRAPFIADAQGWRLDSVLRTDVSKAGCASVRGLDEIAPRAPPRTEGAGEAEGEDTNDGKRCGNIAVVHSLLRLGVLSAEDAFEGEHMKKALIERIDRFHDADGGMTADQQRRAYEDFSPPNKRIECTTGGLAGDLNEDGDLQAGPALVLKMMRSTQPVFDCSLAVRGDRQPDGSAGFRHVEHIREVRRTDAGDYEIDTYDGLKQGTGSAGVPKAPATNTWGIGPRWIQFKTSTDADHRRRYSEEDFHAYDIRCCYVREVP